MYKEIEKCRICGNKNLKTVVDLGMQKLTGVFPLPDQEVDEGPLELVKCVSGNECEDVCGLVQLKHSCDGEEMYGDNYGYRSGLNRSMVEHLTSITTEIKSKIDIRPDDLIVDIGSNDCTLLKSYGIEGADYVGMDPTGVKFKSFYPDYVELYPDFFSADNIVKIRSDKKAKVVTSIAMFYDLEDPVSFAKDVEHILDDNGIWVLEQSYFPMMIESNSYDTICQEHFEFYSLKQIDWIMKCAGLRIIDVVKNYINGGSFRLTVVKENSSYSTSENVSSMQNYEKENGIDSVEIFEGFRNAIEESKDKLLNFLSDAKKNNKKVYGYGASTKGNVLLQYCGITPDDFIAIAEVNEDKFGHVTPGTNIPIISEDDAKNDNPDYFVVLPWHFKDNILQREEKYRKDTNCKFVFPLPEFEIL